MVHELKLDREWFPAVAEGRKTVEIRFNDRDYQVGDVLLLKETEDGIYTGEELRRVVTHVLAYNGLRENWVALSIADRTDAKAEADKAEGWEAAIQASRHSYENPRWFKNPYVSGPAVPGYDQTKEETK
ncbi:DUF3850 domain-containing protein [Subtercola endophyticus]|uniref:DUF3850 domain-containing protein n=1 Tax=Subtercola endophyticus TaxID=2895559 RepID=UPI001E2B0B96|nr:DUF3850 domain-containing protein [Subtercola endophyticus]UFS61261.1 DUF3850 domain-containing protein [Subtercola endophyticus]